MEKQNLACSRTPSKLRGLDGVSVLVDRLPTSAFIEQYSPQAMMRVLDSYQEQFAKCEADSSPN